MGRVRKLRSLSLFWGFLLLVSPALAQRDLKYEREAQRFALVIGNNAYEKAPLLNAVNDARSMGKTLKDLGFDVDVVVDAGAREMDAAVNRLATKLGQGDVALFYYAGHGVQIDGENYLIPTDFQGSDEADVKFKTQAASWVQSKLDKTGSQLKIIVLDACRTNPFRLSRGAPGGLAQMQGGRGTFVAFATAAGKVANDNVADSNGLFTKHLMQVIKQPGLTLDEVFNHVRTEVDKASGGDQLPYVYSGVIGQFYFKPAVVSNVIKDPKTPPPIRLTSAILTMVGSPGAVDARIPAGQQTEFLTTDPRVFLQFTYTGGHKGDPVRVEWLNPFGVVTADVKLFDQPGEGGSWAWSTAMAIAGQPASFTPGNWRVRLYYANQGIAEVPFRISAPVPSAIDLVSSPLLPQGTTGEVYTYRLIARGGRAPYRWSGMDLPSWMTLATNGALSGTPPTRGGFRFSVRAIDAVGNEMNRTVALGVGVTSAVRATGPVLAKSLDAADACAANAVVPQFRATDERATVAFRLQNAKSGQTGAVEWLDPSGDVVLRSAVSSDGNAARCYTAALPIKGGRPASSPGIWRVRLLLDTAQAFRLTFLVLGASEAVLGATQVNPKDELTYVRISPGTFTMGCSPGDKQCFDNEVPVRSVTISKGFWLAQTPVTVGAWRRYSSATGKPPLPTTDGMGRTHLNEESGDDTLPAVSVTWDEARQFCQWSGGRLPTEAEWEFAARAGNPNARYGELDAVAWFANNSGRERIDSEALAKDTTELASVTLQNGNGPHPVGQKQPNAWNLYDMLGNVWQWTSDLYDDFYATHGDNLDPKGPATGRQRVQRGGSWAGFPTGERASRRGSSDPGLRRSASGFRCAAD